MQTSTDQREPVQQGPTTEMSVWARRLLFLRILLITVLLLGILVWLLSFVSNPILILIVAALLAYAVVPVIDFLHRVMPQAVAIMLVYVVAIIAFGGLAYLGLKTLIPQLNSLAQGVTTFVAPGSNGQESPLDQILTGIGIPQSQIDAAARQLQSQLSIDAATITKGIASLFGNLIDAVFNIVITIVVSIYLLVDGYRFRSWLIKSSPLSQRGRISSLLAILQRVVGGYIRGQFCMSVIMGVLQGVGMAIIGVPFALFIGVLAAILAFIPIIGTIIVGFVAVLIALTQSWTMALIALAYTIFLDNLEAYVLSPRILGNAVQIRPVVMLLAMIAGSQVFGIWGAILAAPAAGLIQALVGAYWQYYQKTHSEEFPVQQVEQAANPQEQAAQVATTEPAVNEPLP